MAYVTVPKDLSRVKSKIAFNLTKRQLICFGIGALIGFPLYYLARGVVGTTNAATLMVLVMLPAFFFAMYEKDGLYLEVILKNIIRVKIQRPAIRRYMTRNRYASKRNRQSEKKMPEKGGRNDGRFTKK